MTQSDHARLAADLLALMRLPGLVEHPRRVALLRAVADHDNGWWEADAAPRIDGRTGQPLDFRSAPRRLVDEIGRRAVERFAAADPYRAALIAAHRLRLGDDPTLADRRDELLAQTTLDLADLEADLGWLRLADALSLVACTGDPALLAEPGWTCQVSESDEPEGLIELRLAPFPLAGSTRLALRERWLSGASWQADRDLALDLAAARWRETGVRVVALR